MNSELERLVDLAIADGTLTDKKKEILIRKAQELSVNSDEFELILEGKLYQKKLETNKNDDSALSKEKTKFGVPLWLGWVINGAAWVLFIATFNHTIDILIGLACCFSFYIGLKHAHRNLQYTSIVDAIWMLAWGFGAFGSWEYRIHFF